jgi:DnaJ homolog subfamily C member 7
MGSALQLSLPASFSLFSCLLLYVCVCSDFEKAGEIYSNATGDEDDEKSNKAELKAVKTKIQQAKVALKRSKRKDLYALMGVAQTATEEEIKKAYKKKALIYHPDRNHSKTDAQKAENEKIFKEINSAYEILTDPQKKALYDQGVEEEDMESAMQQRYGSQNDHDDEPGCGRRGHSRGGGHGFGGFGGGGFGGGGFGGDPNDMFREYMRQQQR